MGAYIGSLGNRAGGPSCEHSCAQCGMAGTSLLFDMTRGAVISIVRNHKEEKYRPGGVGGGAPYSIHAELAEGSEQVELPPPPPEVWLVYKHGGAYGSGEPLQGIYATEEGAKDSVRFAVKDERRSLAHRLGQPETAHHDEEPVLIWKPVHHERYGPIPGHFYAEAGLANFTVKKSSVHPAYLPDTTWCKVPHITEE